MDAAAWRLIEQQENAWVQVWRAKQGVFKKKLPPDVRDDPMRPMREWASLQRNYNIDEVQAIPRCSGRLIRRRYTGCMTAHVVGSLGMVGSSEFALPLPTNGELAFAAGKDCLQIERYFWHLGRIIHPGCAY